jgi:2',3'-cyclic-nucleotide 2'-phosphodiesterase (5'-nucleotidase family)
LGGLSEKGFKLRQMTENTEGRAVRVDSGNLFFKRGSTYADLAPETIQAEAIAKIYTALDYDAVAVGADDLSAGIGFLRAAQENGLNLVSANLYDEQQRVIFKPYQKRTVDSFEIAIVGITGPAGPEAPDYHIGDPIEALDRLMPKLKDDSDMIVLLSPLSVQETTALVERFPALRIAISADKTKANVSPVMAGNGLIVQTAGRGQYLGVLTIGYHGGPWRPASARAEQAKQAQKQPAMPATNDDQFSTYRCDYLKMKQTGRSDAQIRSIIDQAKRKIREIAKK